MATEDTSTTAAKNAAGKPEAVNLRLMPADGSDCPVFANVAMVQPAQGAAILDFGFLDPRAMNAAGALAREGKKVPERMDGRLVVRVALSYDALANLQRQLAGVLQAVARARRPGGSEKKHKA